jgi:hypothetical protein
MKKTPSPDIVRRWFVHRRCIVVQQDVGRVVLGWTLGPPAVSRSALDALSASATAKGGAWLVAVQGSRIEPLAGDSVVVGVEVARHEATEYFESGLRPDDVDLLEATLFTSAQVRAAKKEVLASAAEALAWVNAQGLKAHASEPALYVLASGAETRARVTGAGMKPVFNGPESFGPRPLKTKGTEFALVAWAQPL